MSICVSPSRVSSKWSTRTLCSASHLAILLAAALLSSACTRNDPAEALADYNIRLGRLLGDAPPPAAATRVPTWPALPEPPATTAAVRIDVFGFPDAGRCGLLQEISTRNSGLIRVQTPAERLLHEMRLLRALTQCHALTAGDLQSTDVTRRAFAATVRDALERKREDLPRVYWNNTFGATEFREFFSVGALPLRIGETTPVVEAGNAISWLAGLGRLRQEAPLPAPDAMAQQYYRLVGNKLGGRTWLSIDLAMRELDRASVLLERASPAALCPGGKPGTRAGQLHELFVTRYSQRLQPWMDASGRSAGLLADALDRLWDAQRVEPLPELQRYRQHVWADAPGSLVHDYDLALQRHLRAWQALLRPCGYAPGRSYSSEEEG